MLGVRDFGERPAYTSTLVLVAGAACLLLGVGLIGLSVTDLTGLWWPGMLFVAFAFTVFLYGVLLIIRFLEARDAMTDTTPRVRLYDTRHEGGAYLLGVILTLTASVWAAMLGADPLRDARSGPLQAVAALFGWAVTFMLLLLWLRTVRERRRE